MKKTVKKLTAVGLTLTTVMSLAACGDKPADNKGTESKVVTKPSKITIMVDNTIVTEANGGEEFYAYLEKLMEGYGDAGKIDLEFTRPDHNSYYDQVAIAMNGNEKPDVVLLSSDYYALYAANGLLWDMSEAWENSVTKNSGRLIDAADQVLSALVVNNDEGGKAMYGFSPYRGNGCCTYIKKSWLDNAGVAVSDVQGKQMTFDEYYELLKKLKAGSKSAYVISGPGFISSEAPYTNYLPEFYQQAQYTFYKDASGKYVDGFTQQAMKDALQRIQTAVKDGIINIATETGTTAIARNIFYSTDETQQSGVFTYWAGTWASTLKTNLEQKKMNGELVYLEPIKELGAYVERIAPAWCITSDCKNPEGVFKYFIDTMLDGGDFQMAWEYGAKGTHWDDKAETVTLASDTEGKNTKTYKEGEFHFLPSPEKPTTLMKKNHIDPPLALAEFADGKTDPGKASMEQIAKENAEWFSKSSAVAVALPMTEELGENIADINKKRNEIISKVAKGEMTVDAGMEDYTKVVGSKVKVVIDSLNK